MNRLHPLDVDLRGGHLIEASAGTGKTYTITTLVLRLVVELGLGIDRILVMTFTEAATRELHDRIRRRLRQVGTALASPPPAGGEDDLIAHLRSEPWGAVAGPRIEAALRGFDEAAISTIHGFCSRMLRDNAFESGAAFETELAGDAAALIEEITTDFWVARLTKAPPLLVRLLEDRRQSPATLASWVAKALAQPDLTLLPRTNVDPAATCAAFERAYRAARSAVLGNENALVDLLMSAPLNRRSYRRDWVESWVSQAAAYLAPPSPQTTTLPGRMDRLTSSVLATRTNAGAAPPAHPAFGALDTLLAAARDLDAVVPALRREAIDDARSEHRRRKDERQTRTYDDLLQLLDEALDRPDGERLAAAIRRRFGAALIDEFQDTDRLQARIFDRVWAHTGAPLFFIGDPKQSIYAFRGADVHSYLAVARGSVEQAHTLATNWRSDPALVRGVAAVFGRAERPFLMEGIDLPAVTAAAGSRDLLRVAGRPAPPLQIQFIPRDGKPCKGGVINRGWADQDLPALVAAEISRLLRRDVRLDERPLAPDDIAVLVRTNQQAADLQVALRALRIPSVVHAAGSVMSSPEARELQVVLAAVADPRNGRAVRSALATELLGLDARQLDALRADDDAWDRWIERFSGWRQLWEERGIARLMNEILGAGEGAVPTRARLLALPGGERRMTNLLHLGELLHEAAVGQHLGMDGLQRWLHRQRDTRSVQSEEQELRLESDADAVQLVTMHKAKGLQWPVVLCPYLWDGRLLRSKATDPVLFHDPDHALRPSLDLGSERLAEHRGHAAVEAMAELLRLAYVALTRAQHLCVAWWGAFREFHTSALGYLLHAPPGGGDPDHIAAHVRSLDDDALAEDLDALVARAGGAVDWTPAREDPGVPLPRTDQRPASLSCRTPRRRPARTWRTASFSAMASSGALTPETVVGRDRDEAAAAPVEPADARAGTAGERHRVVLADFPAGPRAGHCVHALFEHLDFRFEDRDELVDLARRQLDLYGLDVDGSLDALVESTEAVLDTPLDPDDPSLTLRSIPRERRLDELEFLFPACHAAGAAAVTGASLASLLSRHTDLPGAYLDRVAELGFAPLRGYLRGFIDLVFEHGGRTYVIDYKSNHLGPWVDDYGAAAVAAAMQEHHYVLQALLYTVAIHRYLRFRVAGYDPERHLGGVRYLFIRGMSPDRPGHAVFRDRPSPALVEELSRLFDGVSPGEGGAP